ncbi:hypothetical protein HBI39_241200 [Parastagonospora nodorum]|nr:hypothetical protein HBI39_241200 [Parastagonospora nodorum]
MANILPDDLREYALSLPVTGFPKGFYCALDGQVALDAYKLLCCNKVICPPCQEKLAFPTTCPSCDHSPLEAESCAPNKTLRNTIRIWLQKQKKKEEKAATQASATSVESMPAAPEVQPPGDAADKPVDSIEEASKVEGISDEQAAVENSRDADERAGSVEQPNEGSIAPQNDEAERRGSVASQTVAKGTDAATVEPNANAANGGMMGNNPMPMNGMAGQMGYGFNSGMGFGMNNISGMNNMMANGNWNGMNSMDFNNMNGMANGMYGNYGGNMGMGMNDMSAMNYNGNYGGWNGMGGGYGNYNNNGFSSMGGYNQSGAYPEMMNQFPKHNFPNQNQNRFPANQGAGHPQRNMRNGSHGSFGSGFQNANSRPGSRSGPAPNRDGQSPDGIANKASDAKTGDEQTAASAGPTEEGKTSTEATAESSLQTAQDSAPSGDTTTVAGDATNQAGDATNEMSGLNPIQTFDSGDMEMDDYSQPMTSNGMPYAQGMMGQGFEHTPMDPSFNSNMQMGYSNYGSRGAFNSGAYGAAKVLTDQPTEPIGVGVAGAPTGPRAMREGRPNTGFSSRVNSARFVPTPKSVTSAHDIAPTSPQRRVRSRSPQRDESMRVANKSPSRSRSRSRKRDDKKNEYRGRTRSADLQSRRDVGWRSAVPKDDSEYDQRKERLPHRSSRNEGREEDDDERRDDRASRGDRTRTASVESKYRSSRPDKDKHRPSRSHRDRSKEHGRRHRSRSPGDEKYDDKGAYARSEKDSDGSSRRKHRPDKEKYRDLSRDRERDRKDRKERDRDYDYDRTRDKDRDRKRRKGREAEDDERGYDDDKHRSSRRSRKERDRERSPRHDERERGDREFREKTEKRPSDREEDIVGAMMQKRATSPPLNAPTGPSANGFSIKGRSKNVMPPPVQPPTGPRAFQPPKGPAADRNRDHGDAKDHRRKSSTASIPSRAATPKETQDHYAAERERNARERDSRDKPSKPLHSRISSSSRPSLSSKRSYDDDEVEPPRGPKADARPLSGLSSHRDKRRKSGATGDDNIARLFTAGLRKNAKARRGGVRTEGDMERDLERVERERERM